LRCPFSAPTPIVGLDEELPELLDEELLDEGLLDEELLDEELDPVSRLACTEQSP
jgi:hypothetical protein